MTSKVHIMKRKVTEQLSEWKRREGHYSLIVRGARQVGKTYIIQQFATDNYPNVIYINFELMPEMKMAFEEDLTVDAIVRNLSYLFTNVRIVARETVFILDEIQACPKARTSLKSFSLDGRYDVIASGSLLGIELADVPSLPVGYTESIQMHPMDFEEFLWALDMPSELIQPIRKHIHEKAELGNVVLNQMMKYLDWYLLTGGMPEVVAEFTKERKFDNVRRIQQRIVQDYREDVIKYCENRLKPRTLNCLDSINRHLAKDNRRFNYSDVERSTTKRGVDYYGEAIDWLRLAGIGVYCNRVTDPNIPFEESLASDNPSDDSLGTFKLYLLDTGLLASTYDKEVGTEILRGNIEVNRGALTENLVANMLYCQGRKLFYFEKVRDVELDFLLMIQGRSTAVEVKSGRNRTHKSLNKAMERYELNGIMFDTGDIRLGDDGVVHYPLFAAAFLDEIDPPMELRVDFDPSEMDDLAGALGVEAPGSDTSE